MKSTEYPIAVEIKNSEDLKIDFGQCWFALKRRWFPAMTIAGGFLAVSYMGIMQFSQPSYVAEGKILVKPDESASLTGLIKGAKNQLTPLTLQGNPLKTETEIILSKPVIEAIWYLFLKYKGFRKADLRSPATIRVQENEKS